MLIVGGKKLLSDLKNFCNLSVRLGYYFALVDANLGEYLTENYCLKPIDLETLVEKLAIAYRESCQQGA